MSYFVRLMNNSLSVNSELPPTNVFLYKENKYPFNIIIFNQFSKYFEANPPQLNSTIKLIDDSEDHFNLHVVAIKDFINYCQCVSIILTNENILTIHHLAKKYKVHTLIDKTEGFISDHKEDFLVEFLNLIQDQQDINTHQYEEIISENMLDYIRDDQILSLPFPMLFRIVTKYQLKIKETNLQQPPEMIKFLFKCLDHFKQPASSLFENVDFGEVKSDMIHLLLTEYSDKFDFHFINSNLLKSLYDLQTEIIHKEENIAAIQTQMNVIVSQQNEQIAELKKQIDDLKKQPITVHYLYDGNHSGIVALLKDSVNISAGGYHNPNHPVTNLMEYSNSYFYNYFNSAKNGSDYEMCKSENDSYIEFDFGSKKVDLFSYFIQSNQASANWFHAKSWRIEGSNDREKWDLLDLRIDNEALHGPSKEDNFMCAHSKYGNINNRYKYIRYVQTNSWHSNKYNVYMCYFELYGDIYD